MFFRGEMVFYCQPCGTEGGYPTFYGIPQSFGECELCKKRKPCFDGPRQGTKKPATHPEFGAAG